MKPDSVPGTEPTIFDLNARRYAESPVHRAGPSLPVLLRLAQPGPEDVVLDVATGTGHTALAVAEYAAEVIGLDVSTKMLAEAGRLAAEQGRGNVRFVEGSAEALPFPDNRFTLVTARHAPHHFRSVETFLAEAFRVLKAGGRFVLADQVSPADEDRPWIDRWEIIRDPSHVTQRTPEAWRELAARAGFVHRESADVFYDLEFGWWTQQAGATPEQIAALQEHARVAPPETARRMSLAFDATGRVRSHKLPMLVARFDKE
ncbi:MAG: methyltransferase domain-containing protein [Verrucomicrobia bacterium]|nr:methyltransferase domain-containing protein [Verrucomicrobiota bacterium]